MMGQSARESHASRFVCPKFPSVGPDLGPIETVWTARPTHFCPGVPFSMRKTVRLSRYDVIMRPVQSHARINWKLVEQ
jgi:hypothetical protein